MPVVAAAAGLVAIGLAIGIFFAVSDDDDVPSPLSTAESKSTAGTLGGPAPVVEGPAVRYIVHTNDVAIGFDPLPPETFLLTVTGFATNGLFTNVEEGERLAREWGYVDGYQGSLQPDGALAGVLQGRFFIRVESYLFKDVEGAGKAYDFIEAFHEKRPGSQQQETRGLANESSAWRFTQGTVGTSEVVGVFHRFIFRRGNLVSIVQTFGGEPFMNIDRARDVAVIVDQKALGERPAVTPTPGRSSVPVVPPTPTR
ncbi:MAG: hypothetical protein ACKVVT_13155 [Dehalococcoidia bacterium]